MSLRRDFITASSFEAMLPLCEIHIYLAAINLVSGGVRSLVPLCVCVPVECISAAKGPI